ncbi:MAG TPA: DUF5069 domain-containing protein [Candidatus Binatia bacterium]|nr:DUF5069 domain-containing protein [Candidatus Binatia bacterium]
MTPLDLTKARPRPPTDQLDGVMFLPRTIDKARAYLPGGNRGEYNIPGLSEIFLQHLGLEADAFIAAVKDAATDADVAKWLRAHCDSAKYDSWNASLAERVLTDENRERIRERYPCAKRNPNLTKIVDILETDDRECVGEALAAATQ